MRVNISKGNTKLGAVYNLSLPPQLSCLSNVPCATKCYAHKAWVQYPDVRKAWTQNWNTWMQNGMLYMEEIAQFCVQKRVERFRWHVAGDIPCQGYLDGMNLVASCNPTTRFLAFTKRADLLNVDRVPNLQLVFSMWPNLLTFLRIRSPQFRHLTKDEDLYRFIESRAPIAWMVPANRAEVNDTWYLNSLDTVERVEGLSCSGHCDQCFLCWYTTPGSSILLREH